MRRRLREAYRATREAAPDGVQVVVIGKARVLETEQGVLEGELGAALRAMRSSASGR